MVESERPPFATLLDAASKPGSRRSFAFELLVRPLLGPLRRYLVAQVGDAADDLLDEVMLTTFENLDRFRGTEASFRSWIFTIAHHHVVDLHRRRRAEQPLERLAFRRAADDTEAEAISHLAEGELRHALDGLAPAQRQVLLLRLVADLSIEQTAAVLGRSSGAVKALQHRAIEAARRRVVATSLPHEDGTSD
jgi:RNA polymerase sigma factor (sigma-70 family)